VNIKKEYIIEGISSSEGVVIGKAYVFTSTAGIETTHVPKYSIKPGEVKKEIARFNNAMFNTQEEFKRAKQELAKKVGAKHAKIFDAHILILEDKVFLDQVAKKIKETRHNAESAFDAAITEYLNLFLETDEEFMRERAADIKDIRRRVLNNLIGSHHVSLANLEKDVIVVAHDLSPSDTATMDRGHVVGMVTEVGGPTSHTSIMARAMEIPAITGATDISITVQENDTLIIDGDKSVIIVHPTQKSLKKYEDKLKGTIKQKKLLRALKDVPAITTDEHKISLLANIETPEEVLHVIENGGEGIGLYRTEFFFMNRQDLPSEDEQFEAYNSVVEKCKNKPVIIRTLDLGGDKFASSLKIPREMNPFMGWRAIRLCLERHDIFKPQLRAILRASANGNVKIMFPMISTIQEVRAAKKLIEECKKELRDDGKSFDENMEIGIMIEIPSAAIAADVFAKEVDFFSIGTNDLIQYCLAIDRINEKTAHMYDPMNIAVLRLLKVVVDAAHNVSCKEDFRKNISLCPSLSSPGQKPIKVCVCGEIASHPLMAYLLVGLGVDELSTVASSIPKNKKMIRTISYEDSRKIVEQALNCDDSDYVEKIVSEKLAELKLNGI